MEESITVPWQEGSRKKDWKSVVWLWEKGSLVALLRAAPLVGRLGSVWEGSEDKEQMTFQEDCLERKEDKWSGSLREKQGWRGVFQDGENCSY